MEDCKVNVEVRCHSLQALLLVEDVTAFLPQNADSVPDIIRVLEESKQFPPEEDWLNAMKYCPIKIKIPTLSISYSCDTKIQTQPGPQEAQHKQYYAFPSVSEDSQLQDIENIVQTQARPQEAQRQKCHTSPLVPEERQPQDIEDTIQTQPGPQAAQHQEYHAEESQLQDIEDKVERGRSQIYNWSHNATKFLINTYRENKENFFNRGIKKDILWKNIAEELNKNNFGQPSAQQVEDKFKNLRRNYAKIKDLMGPNSTGAPARGSFRYYHEMDEVFKRNPSFTPPLVVSNLRSNEVQVEEDEKVRPSKRRRETRGIEIREQMHREILEELKKARETLSNKLDLLIEKL